MMPIFFTTHKHRIQWIEVIFILFLLTTKVDAQSSRWQITLPSGAFLTHLRLDSLVADTLIVTRQSGPWSVPLDSIVELREVNPSIWFPSALVGLFAGVMIGSGIESNGGGHPDFSGLANAVKFGGIFAVVGGIIGGIAGADDVYELGRMSHAQRVLKVQEILIDGR